MESSKLKKIVLGSVLILAGFLYYKSTTPHFPKSVPGGVRSREGKTVVLIEPEKAKATMEKMIQAAEAACPWDLRPGNGIGKVTLGATQAELKSAIPTAEIHNENFAKVGSFRVRFRQGKVEQIILASLATAPDCFTFEGKKIEKTAGTQEFQKLINGCIITTPGPHGFENLACPGNLRISALPDRPGSASLSLTAVTGK